MKKFYLLVVSLLLLVVTACGAASGDAYLPSYNESASSNQPDLEESTDEYLELQESDYVNTQDARQSDLLKAQQDRLASKQAYDTAIVGLY